MKTAGIPTLYFENAAGRLLEDPAGFVRANWGGQPRTADDVRGMFTHIMRGLQRHGWNKVLVNQVGMRPFSPQEQVWIASEWLPRAVREGGYRYGAVVVSHDVITRLATAYITTQVAGLPLLYHSFDDEAAAVAWLLQRPG